MKAQKSASSPSTEDKKPLHRYDHGSVETKWQAEWAKHGTNSIETSKPLSKTFYNLMMFPYPSAEGLHVGNMYAFTGSDIYGRFKRMEGYTVFEPIGLDGFGIHSENYALKVGRHPMDHAQITEKNFYNQLHKIGSIYDWTKTVETYDPGYYRWTQWLFVQMFKHGLAYRGKAEVNWCPSCKTVLADEQVIDGACERCNSNVTKRALEQWFFKITAYTERLLQNLDTLNWSEKVITAQRNWIGKKTGIEITYPILDESEHEVSSISCFTTRPDTNFGATFIVIAPDHTLVESIINQTIELPDSIRTAVSAYSKEALNKSDEERKGEGRKKTGVFTGLYALNHLNGAKLPIYVSDFVLSSFGTGAVVGVPGHDKRDYEFASVFDLPIVRVVVASDGDTSDIDSIEKVQEEEGTMVNSGFLDGLNIHDATQKMMDHLVEKEWGKRVTSYHLRDWLLSRQRYWGPPIPMIFCKTCAKEGKSFFTTSEAKKMKTIQPEQDTAGWYPVPESDLPVVLPRIDDYKPGDDGIAPLAKHKEFFDTVCPGCGGAAVRETDVSDTFLDSSWYFLRYSSVGSNTAAEQPFDPEITKCWLPVHMYTGGAEHSVLHLMYSRFVTMALHDWGYLSFEEPFSTFFAHGLVIKDGAKMSKSKGNVVNPDEYINLYGADALRLYLMFMGPFSQGGDFRDAAMEGMNRWVGRIWRLFHAIQTSKPQRTTAEYKKVLSKTIKKVGDDLEKRQYNTAIAAMMECTNALQEHPTDVSLVDFKEFIQILAPLAPHITEEMWHLSGEKNSIHTSSWPTIDVENIREEQYEVVIQVNGKVRDRMTVSSDDSSGESDIVSRALRLEKIQVALVGKKPKKHIYVAGRLLNFVI